MDFSGRDGDVSSLTAIMLAILDILLCMDYLLTET